VHPITRASPPQDLHSPCRRPASAPAPGPVGRPVPSTPLCAATVGKDINAVIAETRDNEREKSWFVLFNNCAFFSMGTPAPPGAVPLGRILGKLECPSRRWLHPYPARAASNMFTSCRVKLCSTSVYAAAAFIR
jgi:hypothetical protein